MADTFVATGLLGSGPSNSLLGSSPITDGLSSVFLSNGLLGGLCVAPTHARPEERAQEFDESSASEQVEKKNAFQPNGLLGSHDVDGSQTDTCPSSGISYESQDDHFPPISDILGLIPQGPRNTVSSSSRSFIPTLIRTPLRATTYDGNVINIGRKRYVGTTQKTSSAPTRLSNLLDVPIHRLKDELSVATASKLSISKATSRASESHKPPVPEETLWVDRYRPRKFTELLGNERVARETMAWLKQWDWCVFGKKKSKKRLWEDDENYNPDDEYHRPREKLLLISGPPGLGKTTLAHVVAKQAGYEVMEINASDARSAQVIDERIRPALESGSAVGSVKPMLLIIDEIDGATGGGDSSSGFVNKLVSLTFDKPKNKRKKSDQKDKRPLLRPIICICNDQNANALAKLRPHARQIRYTRLADSHIVKRLREICELEGLRADTRALSTLVGVAKGDLRGCLNTLQFIKSRNDEVTEPLIRRATVGMKEGDTTATSVINEIFAPLSRKRVKELGMGEEEEARYVNRLSHTIEGLNNPASIANGCFAHYINCHRHDANLNHYEKAGEWLTTFDSFSSVMYTDGDFALHTYLSYFLVPFHPLFRERGEKRVERDSSDWDNLQLTRANEEIYKSLANGIRSTGRSAGANRHLVTGQVLQLEFAPFINRIISPPLRPVNSQVIKPQERALLSRLVEIMVSFELRFVQEKAEDGQNVYRLDPPIDVFITYDGKRAEDITVSRYAVRQLVATEIDAALVAKQADAVEKGKEQAKAKFFKTSRKGVTENVDEAPEPMEVIEGSDELRRLDASSEPGPENKRARTSETVDIADKPPVDFFGRPIAMKKDLRRSSTSKKVVPDFHIAYKHLEGNSAAVRRPTKVSSFL
ncbi:P-loop containing nucleoside triphosphate hydrolase protein [Suillus placidus]|uniref:P-loop containing nucleoside triphosphate hydrolase protein n=1 Tax=Suillus placidus TaxID=48579 RepID=A0A9P6ZYF4_9AGAM|nr:P-loop containing nucleoside triphosphate hydrolase protein [Suillus placidus]